MAIPVITFLAVSVIIGLYAGGLIEGKVKNYYVAGNTLPFWVLAFSQTGQAIESGSTFSNATFAFQFGFWAGAILPIGIGLSLLLIGLFFAEPLNRMKLLTLPDYYLRRYNRVVELLASIMTVFSFVILLAANIAGIGILFHYIFGLPQKPSIAGIAFVIMIYTMAGGLFAVTWNDILQIGVAIIAFVAAFVWLTFFTPESGTLLSTTVEKFSFTPMIAHEEGALANWGALLALALGDIIALDFMERVFAANSPRAARIACYISGFLTIAIGTVVALMGMMAAVFYTSPEDAADPNIFLRFANEHLPPGIAMLVMIALLGAAVSTVDGVIMASSTVITRNILQSNFPNLLPQNRLLFYSRLMALPVTIFAVAFAIERPDPGALLILAFDVVFAGCLVPLALGIYWKRGTSAGAFWAIVVPSALRIFFYFLEQSGSEYFLKEWKGLDSLLPPVVSCLLYVSISLLGKPQALPEGARA